MLLGDRGTNVRVNDLPRVAAWTRGGLESNRRPADRNPTPEPLCRRATEKSVYNNRKLSTCKISDAHTRTFRAMTRTPDATVAVLWIFHGSRRTERHAQSLWKCLEQRQSSTAHWRRVRVALLFRNAPSLSQLSDTQTSLYIPLGD